MSDDYNASTDSILPEIFVSITQVEGMDAALVTSGACIKTKPASKLHCLEIQCTKGRVDLVCSKVIKGTRGSKGIAPIIPNSDTRWT